MFSSVSHEFRTPINAFSNALNLLETNNHSLNYIEKRIDEDHQDIKTQIKGLIKSSKKYIKIGQISCKILTNLTEDILDLAKMEAGMFLLDNCEFTLNSLVEEINFIFELQCEQKGLKFKIW